MLPDILYIYKEEGDGEELRYSLRSLKNIPHNNVFISGDLPEWVSEKVIHIPPVKYEWAIMGNRFSNAEAKWRAALEYDKLAIHFIAMNDDFFFLQPINAMDTYQRDIPLPVRDSASSYQILLSKTREYLVKHNVINPKNYELHVPMPMHKIKRLAVSYLLERDFRRGQIVLPRSIYGNIFDVGGKKMSDVKSISVEEARDSVFVSTDNKSFNGPLGEYIKSVFPEPSEYERQ